MRAVFAACAATLLLLLAACGGGSSATPTPDFATLAKQAAVAALPSLADLPGQWTQTQDAGLAGNVKLSPQCDVFSPAVAFPGAAATAQSNFFDGSEGQQVFAFAGVFGAADGATAAMKAQDALFDTCQQDFQSAVNGATKGYLQDIGVNLSPLTKIDINLSRFDLLAEQSQGYRIHVTVSILISGVDYTLDVMSFRSGRLAGALAYGKLGSRNENEETAIASKFTDLLSKAAKSLPGAGS